MAANESATASFETFASHAEPASAAFDAAPRLRFDEAAPARERVRVLPKSVAGRPADSRRYDAVKRGLDVLLALSGLLLLLPVLLLAAILIKLSDFGPILFCQTRVGRGGREFRCYKFRTMIPNAEALKETLLDLNHHADGVTFKIPHDPRATRLGRWLRKSSIDELPQLINVLLGDMSIVGPRPPVPSEVAWYTPHDLRRLEVRPGLTCTWQVSGRGDVPFDEQVRLDVDYIERRSLWLDGKLIFLTIPAVLSGRGAY